MNLQEEVVAKVPVGVISLLPLSAHRILEFGQSPAEGGHQRLPQPEEERLQRFRRLGLAFYRIED